MKNLAFRREEIVDFFHDQFQEEADQVMAEAAVLELVRRKAISAARGAQLLGLHLTEMAELMARHGIAYFTEPPRDPDELLAQLEAHRRRRA